MPNLTAFISYVLITTFTPGPNNIMSMSIASRYGFKKSVRFNLGVFCGFFCIISLCCIVSATLYSLIPSIKSLMTYVGTIYILWLALKIYRSKPTNNNTEDDGNNNFLSGLILQFVNVKVIFYGLTTVSTFIIPFYQSVIALFSFSILLAFVGFMATNCWSLFGLGFQRILISHFKLLNIVMTLLLVYTAASLHF